MANKVCKCGNDRRTGQRDCNNCHAKSMRAWRILHPLTEIQRLKNNCRRYANVYQERGKLIPQPCKECGSSAVEKHHDDYTKPLKVTWLCRTHHLELHKSL